MFLCKRHAEVMAHHRTMLQFKLAVACVVLLACVGWLTFLACAGACAGFLFYFLLVSACPLPRLFVTAQAGGNAYTPDSTHQYAAHWLGSIL